MTRKVTVAIADDSPFFRKVLSLAIEGVGYLDLVGQASNGEEAVALVESKRPQLLTLDLNMPRLDGLGVLRELSKRKLSVDVVVISSQTKEGAAVTMEALALGAMDFITKPVEESAMSGVELLTQQIRRLAAGILLRTTAARAATAAQQRQDSARSLQQIRVPAYADGAARLKRTQPSDIIAIGLSTGGPVALPVVLSAFTPSLPIPIVIVQHMPPVFTASLAESLTRRGPMRVVEATEGMVLAPGGVYLAPGGFHMGVKRMGAQVVTQLSSDPPENHCRPAVDYLFRSVAEAYAGRVTAAILTGMGNDGVKGMRMLKELGACTLAQDEATSTVFGMPGEAIRAGLVDAVVPLPEIGAALLRLAQR